MSTRLLLLLEKICTTEDLERERQEVSEIDFSEPSLWQRFRNRVVSLFK